MKGQATILQFILLFALSVALFSFLTFLMYSYYSNFRKELSKELTELLGSIFLNHFVYLSKECDCGENFYLERSFSTFNLSISPTRLALSEMALNLELPIYRFLSSPKLHNLNYSYNFFSVRENYLFDVKGKKFSLLHNKTHLILDEFPPSIKIYISPPEVIPPQPPTQPTPPFLDGFNYRKQIVVNNTANANTLTNYQILVENPVYDESGLVLSLHLNEGSGTIAKDSSGNANHGTLVNGPTWVDGKFGKALEFDGIDDYITVNSLSPIKNNTISSFTFTAWVKYLEDTGEIQQIFEAHTNTWEIFIEGNFPNLKFLITDDSGVRHAVRTTLTKGLNSWYFIVGTYDGTTQKLFIDGELVASTSWTDTFTIKTGIILGKDYERNIQYLHGVIDEVRIYNRALSEAEIKALYEAKARLDYEDIRFTDSDGQTLLSYWQEADGKFWVKVPSIPASSTKTIYMYYGNPQATSLSDPKNTMFIYEDMESFPTGKLAGSAVYDSTNKWVRLTPAVDGQLGHLYYDKNPGAQGFYARFRFWAGGGDGADAVWLGVYDTSYSGTREDIVDGGYHFTYDEYQNRICFTKSTTDNGDGISCTSEGTIDNTEWHVAEIYYWKSGSVVYTEIYYDGILKVQASDSSPQSNALNGVGQTIFGGRTGDLNNEHRIDDIVIRKYVSPEPSVSIGEEETLE